MPQIKYILWDFDGVIIDSEMIRQKGFRYALREYDEDLVDKLIDYHCENGGISRYEKFDYFLREILSYSGNIKSQLKNFLADYSSVMEREMTDSNLLIRESLEFIQENYENFEMHIVSASDDTELKNLASALSISVYFRSINGSPTPKVDLVKNIISEYNYVRDEIVLIGDSINDYHAAKDNNIHFMGVGKKSLVELSTWKLY